MIRPGSRLVAASALALVAALVLVRTAASGDRPAAGSSPFVGPTGRPATGSTPAAFDGWALLESGPYAHPLSTLVVDAARYAAASGEPLLATQLRAGLVLTSAAAALLGVGAGAVLRPSDGPALRVSAVVADVLLGGRQAAVDARFAAGQGLGLGAGADYLLLPATSADLARVRAAVGSVLPARRLRLLAPRSDGRLVSSGRVLSQTEVQQRFGMLAVRRGAAGLVVDPAWESAYIVQRRIPLLGLVTCNRKVLPALTRAMTTLQRQGLGELVETADFGRQGGCWNPRTVRGRTALSRHAWGIAVDINVAHNPLGATPRQDARLVAVMAQAGFTWGGRFLRPDGAHFEWVGAPAGP